MIILEDGCPQFTMSDLIPENKNETRADLANKQLRDWFESLEKMYKADFRSGWDQDPRDAVYTARLTKPVPIVRDSAESLLRDIVENADQNKRCADLDTYWKLVERARKLLDKGEK